ncbi:hypothetical protein BP422_09050 [Brevibacillus formosus]|uniref:NERD domain-containing protein n=1 Tax=Brevibacillus formosus TaxID=54913 RepID=A0A220MFA6_9BACL|nr:hypothetical protein [Brevibacillus formosus]ASJ53688.1 hypothetical protein BP422_09050 [Brevibacillus formosus]
MIAEIFGKISRTGSNLSDRLEDKLTGDVFGSLRYLPFEAGLKKLLSGVHFEEISAQTEWNHLLDRTFGYSYEMEFWPKHELGEIDLRFTLENSLIGIEVKYFSGLSSEDEDPYISTEDSKNQLSRYSRMLSTFAEIEHKYLVFLAPQPMITLVKTDLSHRSIIAKDVYIGFLSWEEVLEQLLQVHLEDAPLYQKLILQDIQALLNRKGFARFTGFDKGIAELDVTKEAYEYRTQEDDRSICWPTVAISEEDSYVFK